MDYVDQVLAREERLRAEFEAKIYADCDFCKEPILLGEAYYYDGYDRMCERCMEKFESRRA